MRLDWRLLAFRCLLAAACAQDALVHFELSKGGSKSAEAAVVLTLQLACCAWHLAAPGLGASASLLALRSIAFAAAPLGGDSSDRILWDLTLLSCGLHAAGWPKQVAEAAAAAYPLLGFALAGWTKALRGGAWSVLPAGTDAIRAVLCKPIYTSGMPLAGVLAAAPAWATRAATALTLAAECLLPAVALLGMLRGAWRPRACAVAGLAVWWVGVVSTMRLEKFGPVMLAALALSLPAECSGGRLVLPPRRAPRAAGWVACAAAGLLAWHFGLEFVALLLRRPEFPRDWGVHRYFLQDWSMFSHHAQLMDGSRVQVVGGRSPLEERDVLRQAGIATEWRAQYVWNRDSGLLLGRYLCAVTPGLGWLRVEEEVRDFVGYEGGECVFGPSGTTVIAEMDCPALVP